jgi:hypothetical protein
LQGEGGLGEVGELRFLLFFLPFTQTPVLPANV